MNTGQKVFDRHFASVLTRARSERIVDFSEAEIDRVFENVARPKFCKWVLARLIADGLTIEKLYGGNHD